MRKEDCAPEKEETDPSEKLARRIAKRLIELMPLHPSDREDKMVAAIVPILHEELVDDGR